LPICSRREAGHQELGESPSRIRRGAAGDPLEGDSAVPRARSAWPAFGGPGMALARAPGRLLPEREQIGIRHPSSAAARSSTCTTWLRRRAALRPRGGFSSAQARGRAAAAGGSFAGALSSSPAYHEREGLAVRVDVRQVAPGEAIETCRSRFSCRISRVHITHAITPIFSCARPIRCGAALLTHTPGPCRSGASSAEIRRSPLV